MNDVVELHSVSEGKAGASESTLLHSGVTEGSLPVADDHKDGRIQSFEHMHPTTLHPSSSGLAVSETVGVNVLGAPLRL